MAQHMIVAATGHRPAKLGGYDSESEARLYRLAVWFLRSVKPREAISGMALGWDTAFALAALDLDIPLAAYVPFRNQKSHWNHARQSCHAGILLSAARVLYVSEYYSIEAMQKRNEKMVSDCTHLCALWDGSSGGTSHCVRFANSVGRPGWNIWPQWQAGAF